MSLAEIKSELRRLTPAELVEVERHLLDLRWSRDPAIPARVSTTIGRIEAGSAVSGEDIERPHVARLGPSDK